MKTRSALALALALAALAIAAKLRRAEPSGVETNQNGPHFSPSEIQL